MVFNKEKKIAFVLPTRTGSTTLTHYLASEGWFQVLEKHAPMTELLDKYPNLESYKIYGFFRDPLSRFESIILFIKQKTIIPFVRKRPVRRTSTGKLIDDLTYDEVVDHFDEFNNMSGLLLKKQIFWLDHPQVKTLDFHNF